VFAGKAAGFLKGMATGTGEIGGKTFLKKGAGGFFFFTL
jgi:hypothetical protein